jgi:enoyl-CoA hydratase
LILTGEPLTAAEAYHFGLVGHVVPTGQSLDKARQLAACVAANAPLAIRNAKASVINSGWIDEEEARRIEQRLVIEVMRSEDAKEGWAAFAAKREPRSPVSKRASLEGRVLGLLLVPTVQQA